MAKKDLVTVGDFIPNTHLRRCYQNGNEIRPKYEGPSWPPNPIDAACEEAMSIGRRVVLVNDETYCYLFGEWICMFVGNTMQGR